MEIIDGGLRIGKYDIEPMTTKGNVKTLADLEELGGTLEDFVIFHKVEHELNFDPKDFKISVAHISKEIKDKIESLPTNKQNKYITEVNQCLYNFNQYRERFEAFIEVEVEPAYKLKEGSFSPVPLLKMINQDFELLNMNLNSSKILLENPNTEVSTNPTATKQPTPSPDIDVFSNEQYVIFEYLEKEYTRDDKAKPTKYSNIYRFMKYESLINCTQISYKNFLKKHRTISFSKILRKTYKYTDDIKPLLTRIMEEFNQQNKKEQH